VLPLERAEVFSQEVNGGADRFRLVAAELGRQDFQRLSVFFGDPHDHSFVLFHIVSIQVRTFLVNWKVILDNCTYRVYYSSTMTTKSETDTQLQIMVEPHPHQSLIDALSALALLGKIPWYEAKDCMECEDWKRARRLVEEAE